MREQKPREEQLDILNEQAMDELLKGPATPIGTAAIDFPALHEMLEQSKSENPPDAPSEPFLMALIHEDAPQPLAALATIAYHDEHSGNNASFENPLPTEQQCLAIHADDVHANPSKATRGSRRKMSGDSESSKKPNPKQRRPTVISIHESHTQKRDESEDEGDLSWTTKDDKLDITGTTALDAKTMTPTERQIVLLKRKLRNRESARRSRIKKQSTLVQLNEEYNRLKDQFSSLHEVAQAGMEEMEKLRCLNEELRRRIRELETCGDVGLESEVKRELLPTNNPI